MLTGDDIIETVPLNWLPPPPSLLFPLASFFLPLPPSTHRLDVSSARCQIISQQTCAVWQRTGAVHHWRFWSLKRLALGEESSLPQKQTKCFMCHVYHWDVCAVEHIGGLLLSSVTQTEGCSQFTVCLQCIWMHVKQCEDTLAPRFSFFFPCSKTGLQSTHCNSGWMYWGIWHRWGLQANRSAYCFCITCPPLINNAEVRSGKACLDTRNNTILIQGEGFIHQPLIGFMTKWAREQLRERGRKRD